MVHSSDCSVAPRSSRMAGSATVTTRLSRTTMKRASETIASVAPVRLLGEVGDMRGAFLGSRSLVTAN